MFRSASRQRRPISRPARNGGVFVSIVTELGILPYEPFYGLQKTTK
jgi:hypothetical protein